MNWKNLGITVLFPHISILFLLLPTGTLFLVYSMIALPENSPVRISSYVLAFYTLTVWCARTPKIIRFFRNFKNENKYINIWATDPRLRMNITLTGNILYNGAYAVLQLGLGIYHKYAWFYSLAAYYFSLAIMRFFLVRYTLRHKPGEKINDEFRYYRICGWIFLFMNLALTGMIFFMIQDNTTMHHNRITTIAMAAYTFTYLSVAITNVIKYRKYNSPAMSASKAISLAAACVSMLTLENTMLTTFGSTNMTEQAKKLFLSISGGAISVFIIVTAIYMIAGSKYKVFSSDNIYHAGK